MARKNKDAEDGRSRLSKPWKVVVLQIAIDEGHEELNEGEYWHVVSIIKNLEFFGDSIKCSALDIRSIGSLYELREKGGLLGKKNMRFFFGTIPEKNELVVTKSYRKDEQGQTPRHIVLNAEIRFNQYRQGTQMVGAEVRSSANR